MEGLHRQDDHRRRQHRHRRLRPRPGDGDRGAAAVLEGGPARALRLERRRHAHRRDAASASIPRRTLFIVASQDVHDAGDDDQRADRARVVARDAPRTPSAVAKHFVALSTNAKEVADVRHRHREHVRVLGLGRRPLLAVERDRPVDRVRDRHGPLRGAARPAATRWTSTSAPRRSRRTCRSILGMLGVWYANFFGAETHAILPYDQYLHRFAAYFQQGDMETNGKGVDRDGRRITDYSTGPGDLGRARHERPARVLSADPPGHAAHPVRLHRAGRDAQPARRAPRDPARELLRADRGADEGQDARRGARRARRRRSCPPDRIEALVPHKTFTGNRPTTSILVQKLTPRTLGSLIALYEHKIFMQGIIWNIYASTSGAWSSASSSHRRSCRSWKRSAVVTTHDASTNGLINCYKAPIQSLRRSG